MRHWSPARREKKRLSKKVRGWCPGAGIEFEHLTRKAHFHPSMKHCRVREDETLAGNLQKRWRARCPVCNRLLHPKKNLLGVFEREFISFLVPKHKSR
jgi:hypothetical protein